MEVVIAAALEWQLPDVYIDELRGWLQRRSRNSGIQMDVIFAVMIRGRVQGVGYRAWAEVTALELGVEGWVRNRRDGSVEAVLAGSEEVVLTMIELCRDGPPGAQVDRDRSARGGRHGLGVAPSRRSVLGAGQLLSVRRCAEQRLERRPQRLIDFRSSTPAGQDRPAT